LSTNNSSKIGPTQREQEINITILLKFFVSTILLGIKDKVIPYFPDAMVD
jgi:hypothetical protein